MRSSARAHTRAVRQDRNEGGITPEQKETEQGRLFVIFGGKRGNGHGGKFEDFAQEEKRESDRLAQKERQRARIMKALEEAEKNPIKGKPLYIKKPGQEKKGRSKAAHAALKEAAQAKRDRRAGR